MHECSVTIGRKANRTVYLVEEVEGQPAEEAMRAHRKQPLQMRVAAPCHLPRCQSVRDADCSRVLSARWNWCATGGDRGSRKFFLFTGPVGSRAILIPVEQPLGATSANQYRWDTGVARATPSHIPLQIPIPCPL